MANLEATILAVQLICHAGAAGGNLEARALCLEQLPRTCANAIKALSTFDNGPRETQATFTKSQLLDVAALRRFRMALCDTD